MKSLPSDSLPELPDRLSPKERIIAVRDSAGFLATSRREVTEALAVIASKPQVHLNEILLHQQKAEAKGNTDNPNKAVETVALEYSSYYLGARLDVTHLRLLADEVDDTPNPRLVLSDIVEPKSYGVPQLTRFLDLRALTDETTDTNPLDPLGTDYRDQAVDPTLQAHIADVISETTVREARGLIPEALADQESRMNFWYDVLKQSELHAIARPVIQQMMAG